MNRFRLKTTLCPPQIQPLSLIIFLPMIMIATIIDFIPLGHFGRVPSVLWIWARLCVRPAATGTGWCRIANTTRTVVRPWEADGSIWVVNPCRRISSLGKKIHNILLKDNCLGVVANALNGSETDSFSCQKDLFSLLQIVQQGFLKTRLGSLYRRL